MAKKCDFYLLLLRNMKNKSAMRANASKAPSTAAVAMRLVRETVGEWFVDVELAAAPEAEDC